MVTKTRRSTATVKSTPKKRASVTVAGLCQKHSLNATRTLINRVMNADNPEDRMSDSDLIKAVESINNRAFGRPVAQVEHSHDITVDVRVQHLQALKDIADQRIKIIEHEQDDGKAAIERANAAKPAPVTGRQAIRNDLGSQNAVAAAGEA